MYGNREELARLPKPRHSLEEKIRFLRLGTECAARSDVFTCSAKAAILAEEAIMRVRCTMLTTQARISTQTHISITG